MKIIVEKRMVVGHTMRYPGEIVEVPDAKDDPSTALRSAQDAQEEAAELEADEVTVPAALRRRKKASSR